MLGSAGVLGQMPVVDEAGDLTVVHIAAPEVDRAAERAPLVLSYHALPQREARPGRPVIGQGAVSGNEARRNRRRGP